MKKILVTIFALISILSTGCSANPNIRNTTLNNEQYQIKFDNKNFILKHNTYSKITDSYFNEYFQANEDRNNYTEEIAVYYIKIYNSPLEYSQHMAKIAKSKSDLPAKVSYNKQNNEAMIDFILIGQNKKNGKQFIEHNLFRVTKHPSNVGVISLQHIYKYPINTQKEKTFFKTNFTTNAQKWTGLLHNMIIPKIVEKEI